MAIPFLSWREPCLSHVLPVEGTAAEILAVAMRPGPLNVQQVDGMRQRNSPCSQTPGYVSPHYHWPGEIQVRVTAKVAEDIHLNNFM